MLSRFGNLLWMQEDGGQEEGHGHEQSPPMGMQPVSGQEAGLNDNQDLLAMAAAGGENSLAPTMVDEEWYFDESAGADAGGHGSMLMAPGPLGASGSAFSSQFFPFINMGGTGSLGVSGFDLGISGDGGGGGFTEYLGGGNASNCGPVSLFSPENTALMSSFGGFGTSPAQMGELGSLARFGMFDTDAGTRNGSSSTAPALSAPLTTPFSGRGTAAVLRPLEICPPVGAQPNLFQKRALRRNAGEEEQDMKRKKVARALSGLSGGGDTELDDADEDAVSIDASGLNYDSEDGRGVEESGQMDGKESNAANSTVTGGGAAGGKGKKKGTPAKNLLAERRRRSKLNERLLRLRSAVPKISKMDKASILRDAIEYLKELLQKMNDLQNELESSPSTSSLPPTPSYHPVTPTLSTLPSYVKDELYPSALASPNCLQPRVEVRLREGQAVNIHMFCARRPGILLSAMKAMEGIGLDVQQAVINCFNGFALDEQCKGGPGLLPDQIKAVLLQGRAHKRDRAGPGRRLDRPGGRRRVNRRRRRRRVAHTLPRTPELIDRPSLLREVSTTFDRLDRRSLLDFLAFWLVPSLFGYARWPDRQTTAVARKTSPVIKLIKGHKRHTYGSLTWLASKWSGHRMVDDMNVNMEVFRIGVRPVDRTN